MTTEKPKKKKRFYYDNDTIQPIIIKYQKTVTKGKPDLRMLDPHVDSFQQLVRAIINTHKIYRFHNDVEELVQEGLTELFNSLKRFDPDRGTSFNYLSITVKNHLKNWTKNRNKKDWITGEFNDTVYMAATQNSFDKITIQDMFAVVTVREELGTLLERIIEIITDLNIYHKRDIIKFLVREGWPREHIDEVYENLEDAFGGEMDE